MTTNAMVLMLGDLSKAAATIGDVVKRENLAAGKPWAVRVAIGSDGVGWAQQSTDRDGTTGAEALEVMHEYITIVDTEH
ncbi:hypothetical protein NM208_g730 [Fusarium decemcellulare]|uniref:Uncharacterized protein n=1 Tax=Fusarium decemcellulare TaxID=57161 RepID=A0ACC1SYK8_9HYPO|nr:hypothetical protein NM208_g730 [Fusarium decemcellulare]